MRADRLLRVTSVWAFGAGYRSTDRQISPPSSDSWQLSMQDSGGDAHAWSTRREAVSDLQRCWAATALHLPGTPATVAAVPKGDDLMYAVFTEVNANESHIEAGREFLPQRAAPMAQERGAKGGYWLAPQGGRGVAIVVFETEEEARTAAAMFRVGEPPMPDAPEGVTVKTVEVREVLAAV